MSILFWVSYAALWFALACAFVAILFLYRYLGQRVLDSREGRARQGPEYNRPLPHAMLTDIDGQQLAVGPSALPRLLYFATVSCKTCARALPALSRFAARNRESIETILVCWATGRQSRDFAADCTTDVRVIGDAAWEFGTRLRVSSTPFAVLLDTRGIVQAKGTPVTGDDFDAFTEHVPSIEGRRPRAVDFESDTHSGVAIAAEGE